MSGKFIKTKEDFKCENCGHDVVGNGYTNHCPKCLWSKHVDLNPGDREALCKGMMAPVLVVYEKGEYVLTHECGKCGTRKNNKVTPDDDMDTVIALSKKVALREENKNPRLKF